MLFRRVMDADGTRLSYEESADGIDWGASEGFPLGYESPFRPEWETTQASVAGVKPGQPALPFEPVSFRDFMLFRDHYIGAARGWVRRFRPGLSRVVQAAEAVVRPFPPFRPPKLWDEQPIYYMSNARTFVPSGTPITAPGYTTALDWELELGFVINAPLRDASPEEAEAAIGGFVLLNDFSARDIQIDEQNSGFGPQKAKHFQSSLSATMASPADVLPRWKDLRAVVSIDGTVVSRPSSSNPRFELGDTLAHASRSEHLQPGELFSTGTFVRGSGMEIDTWLQPGNTLRLELEGVGVVEHRID